MNDFLRLENRHTGEVLRLRRVRDGSGEVVLTIEGSLPPHSAGPPPHIHFLQREEGRVLAGMLGARVGKEKIALLGNPSSPDIVFAFP